MKKEKFEKINEDIYKRTMEIEQEDILKVSHLEQEKRDLEEKIKPWKKRHDEVEHILSEIKKLN